MGGSGISACADGSKQHGVADAHSFRRSYRLTLHVLNSHLDFLLFYDRPAPQALRFAHSDSEVATMRKHEDGTRRATHRARRIGFRPRLDGLERRVLLTSQTVPPILVTSTSDTPVAPTPDVPDPLTLRQAITEADASPVPVTIDFALVPQNVPGVVDFNLATQVWTIHVNNNVPLPPITKQVTIDGYSQEFVPSTENPNVFQKVQIIGAPTGGTFTLTFEGDTTGPIPFDATTAQDSRNRPWAACAGIGTGNVATAFGPVNTVGVEGRFVQWYQLRANSTDGRGWIEPGGCVGSSRARRWLRSMPSPPGSSLFRSALAVGFNAQGPRGHRRQRHHRMGRISRASPSNRPPKHRSGPRDPRLLGGHLDPGA